MNFLKIYQSPPCKHFGSCGGCILQDVQNHKEYKISLLEEALASINFKGKLHDLFQIKPYTRRRVTFKVSNQSLCFNKFHSNHTTKIDTCLLLLDSINNLIAPINSLLKNLKSKIDSVSITNSDSAIEILFYSKEKPDLNQEVFLTEFAKKYDIGRIAWQINKQSPYPIVQLKRIALEFNNIYIDLPINCFLQVSKESNNYMNQIILNNIDENANLLELYCGIGSFTIPIQDKTRITAVEGNEQAIDALNKTIKNYNLPIKTICKDLYQTPCESHFIDNFSQILINPPRNGASPQIRQIAKSLKLNKVILVSCSLENFIRDARILLQANFNLNDIYPIDQFLYSNHIEIIGVFEKDKLTLKTKRF